MLQENFLFDGTIADNIAYANPQRDAGRGRGGVPPGPLRGVHPALPRGLRHDRRRARHQALGRPAPARVDRPRAAGRPAHPDPRRGDLVARQRERGDDPGRACGACARAAPPSSSPTGCRPSAAPTRSWCSRAARSSSAAPTTSCWPRHGRYRQLYDKQYKIETNRFINPGEDWTPELAAAGGGEAGVDADLTRLARLTRASLAGRLFGRPRAASAGRGVASAPGGPAVEAAQERVDDVGVEVRAAARGDDVAGLVGRQRRPCRRGPRPARRRRRPPPPAARPAGSPCRAGRADSPSRPSARGGCRRCPWPARALRCRARRRGARP